MAGVTPVDQVHAVQELTVPSTAELVSALELGLSRVFEFVEIQCCPLAKPEADMQEDFACGVSPLCNCAQLPFSLARDGDSLGCTVQDRVLLELGHSTDSINCAVNRGAEFDGRKVLECAKAALQKGQDRTSSQIGTVVAQFGPGAAARSVVGVNAELVCNNAWETKESGEGLVPVASLSRAGLLTEQKHSWKQVPYDSTDLGVLANLVVCNQVGNFCNLPSDHSVLRFKVARRRSDLHPEQARRGIDMVIRDALRANIRDAATSKVVGLAGMFIIKRGDIWTHVMGDFPENGKDIVTPGDEAEFKRFFNIRATPQRPMHCLSVICSGDPQELSIRPAHTHYSMPDIDMPDNDQPPCMGHYHYDLHAHEEVQYVGVLAPCSKLVRFGIPTQLDPA